MFNCWDARCFIFYRYINEMIDISYFFAGIFVWVLEKLQFIIQVIPNLYLWFIIDTITHSWSGINLLFIIPISFQHSLQVLKHHVIHMKWIHVYYKCFEERLFCHISCQYNFCKWMSFSFYNDSNILLCAAMPGIAAHITLGFLDYLSVWNFFN